MAKLEVATTVCAVYKGFEGLYHGFLSKSSC